MTAKELLEKEEYYNVDNNNKTINAMIEFADCHVRLALKEAKWRCDDTTNSEGLGLYVENSYPLENIK
jgi:hypothetical protein